MSVYANNRSIIHKGDGGVHTAAPPDVCKTPSPGGPVPIPYVNIATSSTLAAGTKKVKIGGNATANAGSNLSTSSGDEPGTLGGVISSKFKGKMTWASTSTDVKIENKGAARFMDPTQQNGNTFNTAFLSKGGTGFAYGDDFQGACSICGKGPAAHRILETPTSKSSLKDLRDKLLARLAPKMQALRTYHNHELNYNTFRTRLADLEQARTNALNPFTDPSASVSEADLATLDAQIAAVTAQRDVEKKAWKAAEKLAKNDTLKRTSGGYMIGMMICRSEAQHFGAMSGADSTAGFAAEVGNLGWTLCNDGVSQEEMRGMNPNINDQNVQNLDNAWQKCDNNGHGGAGQAEAQQRGESWNKPGICAAAKLLGRSKPHKPRMMTEELFEPVKLKAVGLTYPHIDNTLRSLWKSLLAWLYNDIRFHRIPGSFQDAETVPSCNTCQTLIPFLSCDNQKACS